jgi:hypothetical protein
MLTSAVLDPIGKIPGSKYCGARVERVESLSYDRRAFLTVGEDLTPC